MLKPLSAEGRFESGFDEITRGKVCALTAVVQRDCVGLGLAVANEAGYIPIPLTWARADTWDEMQDHAEALNRELFDLDVKEAARIIISSMAKSAFRGKS